MDQSPHQRFLKSPKAKETNMNIAKKTPHNIGPKNSNKTIVRRSTTTARRKKLVNQFSPKRPPPSKPDLGVMLHVPSTAERLALRQVSKRKPPLFITADRRNLPSLIQCLEHAAEEFKNEASHGFLARKSRRNGIAYSFKAAKQIIKNDVHWTQFKLAYKDRMGVDLSDQDRPRAMFYCLLHAMRLDTEPARKDASRYAIEAQPYLDLNWTGRQFFNALNENGGVTGLRKLRKASGKKVNDPITIKVRRIKTEAPAQSSNENSAHAAEKTSAPVTKETPDSVIIEATLTSKCRPFFSLPQRRRVSLEGVLVVGETIQFNIDRVTAS